MNTIRTVDDIKRLPFITKDEVGKISPTASLPAESTGRLILLFGHHRLHRPISTVHLHEANLCFYIATGVRMYTMIGYRPWHRMAYIKYTDLHYPRLGPFSNDSHQVNHSC